MFGRCRRRRQLGQGAARAFVARVGHLHAAALQLASHEVTAPIAPSAQQAASASSERPTHSAYTSISAAHWAAR